MMSDGLEERKNELFATITLLAGVKRDIAAAQASGAIAIPLYDRQAQLEADKERLSHEVNSEYMYRNLQAFMNRVDTYDAARKKEANGILLVVEETQRGLGELSRQVGDMGATLAAVVGEVSDLKETTHDHGVRLDAHEAQITGLRTDVDRLQSGLRDVEQRLAALESDQQMIRQVLAAHPPPEALQQHGS